VREVQWKRTVYAISFAALLSASLAYVSFMFTAAPSCGTKLGPAGISQFKLPSVHFNGVTKFRLPDDEFPNGIAVASDGSVWFGEQNLPGIAHLFENGTIVEYAWPINYSPSTTSIWGVAQWNGRIWASDALGAQIISLDPTTSTINAIKLSNPSAFPYTLTVGTDDALWFTELYGSKLGRIDAKCALKEYPIPSNLGGTPTQIEFENSTSGYYVDAGNATSGLGHILSFSTTQFAPQPFGGNFRPLAASSLALVPNGLWVAQHASSNLAYYDFKTRAWSQYPTTPVSYIASTLPYFVAANGSLVWFNEHYANRMAVIDTERGLLTEYSLSNPPANKTTQIDNALTFALGRDKVWFTELTANYVGYIDASYRPNFSIIESREDQPIEMRLGDNVTLSFTVSGFSNRSLSIKFADTENFTSRPNRIMMSANVAEIKQLNTQTTVTITIRTEPTLSPGSYILLVTVTDGSVYRGIYVRVQINE
jgi:streptogramin lyase